MAGDRVGPASFTRPCSEISSSGASVCETANTTIGAGSIFESLKFNQHTDQIEAVALVVQNLLINTSGRVVPAPLFTDVQFRFFKSHPKTGETSANAQQFELSRRKLLTAPLTGGFVEHSETSPAYLSVAGNDYDFATPIDEAGAPILVPLRTRCTQCHNRSLTTNLTFAIHDFPPVPTTRILKSSDHERALYVARRKEERADFKSLSPPNDHLQQCTVCLSNRARLRQRHDFLTTQIASTDADCSNERDYFQPHNVVSI